MVGISGYASRVYSVTGTAVTLADMGFTDDEIKGADAAHVSHISTALDAGNIFYWYDGSTPVGGATPEGHPIYPGGERMIRSVRNIRNLQMIADAGTVRVAITLGTFGRGTTI